VFALDCAIHGCKVPSCRTVVLKNDGVWNAQSDRLLAQQILSPNQLKQLSIYAIALKVPRHFNIRRHG